MFLRNRKEIILCSYFEQIKVLGWQVAFFLMRWPGSCKHWFKCLSLCMLEPWILIRLPTWEELSTCVFAGWKIYLLHWHEKVFVCILFTAPWIFDFNFQTFMEVILQLHMFANNALILFALKDVWLLLELKILWSSSKSAFDFSLLMHPP